MSLINRLKPFCIRHRIRRNNRFESRQIGFSGVINTAETEDEAKATPSFFFLQVLVWGYLPLKYFCRIFPLTEEKGLEKSV
jgi:hypothetical protein